MDAAETRAGTHRPQPVGGCGRGPRLRPTGSTGVVRRGHRPPGGPHAEVAALARRRATGPSWPRCTSPSSRAPTRAGPRPAPTPSSAGDPAGGGRHRRPRSTGERSGDGRAAGRPASRWTSGWRRTWSVSSWPPTSSTGAPADRGWSSSWPPPSTARRRHRTGPASGSPDRPPAGTPTGCGPGRMPCWSGRAPSGPTIPPSPCGCRRTIPASGLPTSSRSGWCSDGHPPAAAVRPALELGGDLGAGARRARAPGDRPASGRGGRHAWPTPSTGPVWSTATSSIWPPPCSGETMPGPLFDGPGAPTLGRALAGPGALGD